MMKLFMGISQDPNMADCLSVMQGGIMDSDKPSQAACECIVKVTPEKFISWTGVDMWSCGVGSGFYAAEEQEMCKNMGMLKYS